MERIYFKLRNESARCEWTIYGTYTDKDRKPEGDILCLVHDITKDNEKDHLEHSVYREYFLPEDLTEITREEMETALAKLASTEDLYNKADEILKSLL